MAKICDSTSSGMIFESEGRIVLIERKNYPEAVALPAGHLDGDTPEENAKRESSEEVGLVPFDFKVLWSGDVDNPCKREDGSHHFWTVFYILNFHGELKAGDDAKKAFWADYEVLKKYASRTEYFMKKHAIPYTEVGKLTKAIFGEDPNLKNTDPEWKAEIGLEPVWYYILKKLDKI